MIELDTMIDKPVQARHRLTFRDYLPGRPPVTGFLSIDNDRTWAFYKDEEYGRHCTLYHVRVEAFRPGLIELVGVELYQDRPIGPPTIFARSTWELTPITPKEIA